MIKPIQIVFVISTLLLTALPIAANEIRYVTDILKLSVYEQVDSKGKRLRKISSGEKLSVLAREGSYARVKLDSGEEGWVKSAFLTKSKPAAAKLLELQTQLDDRNAALASVRKRLLKEEVKNALIQEKQDILKLEIRDTNSQMRTLSIERLELLRGEESRNTRNSLPWISMAVLVTLALGFIGGLWWTDYRMRRRHGGFRVY